jgi:hypothetical protein
MPQALFTIRAGLAHRATTTLTLTGQFPNFTMIFTV